MCAETPFHALLQHNDLVNGGWSQLGGQAIQGSGGIDEVPWVINAHHQIYRWNGSGWTNVPGCAISISGAASSYGNPWIVGCTFTGPHGNSVYHWNGNGWTEIIDATGVYASATQISVGGVPWSIDSTGAIFQWSNLTGNE